MNEKFGISYELRILKKIRKELVSCTGELWSLKMGIHYSLSPSVADYPIYTLTMKEYGNYKRNILKIRKKLENYFSEKVQVDNRGKKSLWINVHNYYSKLITLERQEQASREVMIKQNGVNLDSFKISLLTFIQKKTNIRQSDRVNGFQIISTQGKSVKRWVLIHCLSNHALYEIVSVLEKDAYYSNKISVNELNIHVSDYEKAHSMKDLPLIKKFILSLQSYANNNESMFEMETPLMIVASQESSLINLKFDNLKCLESFIHKIDSEWFPTQIDDTVISITVTKKQIKEFLEKE